MDGGTRPVTVGPNFPARNKTPRYVFFLTSLRGDVAICAEASNGTSAQDPWIRQRTTRDTTSACAQELT